MPVSKLQNYFSGLASLLAENSDSYLVSYSGNTTSIELSPGSTLQYRQRKEASHDVFHPKSFYLLSKEPGMEKARGLDPAIRTYPY